MARITVEDCMEHVSNRFHLVRMASIRAKQLKKGALPLLSADGNKIAVMSLREIAAGLVTAAEETPTERYAESSATESTVESPADAAATIQPKTATEA